MNLSSVESNPIPKRVKKALISNFKFHETPLPQILHKKAFLFSEGRKPTSVRPSSVNFCKTFTVRFNITACTNYDTNIPRLFKLAAILKYICKIPKALHSSLRTLSLQYNFASVKQIISFTGSFWTSSNQLVSTRWTLPPSSLQVPDSKLRKVHLSSLTRVLGPLRFLLYSSWTTSPTASPFLQKWINSHVHPAFTNCQLSSFDASLP